MQLPVNRSPAKNWKCSYQLTGHLQKIGDAVTSLNEAFTWFSTALVKTNLFVDDLVLTWFLDTSFENW
jgi:hypothetical protein